ncbi:hypothetical protein TNIN_66501 [Trichonephila inaurata madagascariensis]|uniref:Uncharacterized protein n=1 Tax=Trichonephila inaurata madagascariensis TaxID=2747483 RepID=A0A8X7CRN9_9ARAC|nr:hypothetical protein TNIN_66501 [Trichonephila inaurata madagascariensis]
MLKLSCVIFDIQQDVTKLHSNHLYGCCLDKNKHLKECFEPDSVKEEMKDSAAKVGHRTYKVDEIRSCPTLIVIPFTYVCCLLKPLFHQYCNHFCQNLYENVSLRYR